MKSLKALQKIIAIVIIIIGIIGLALIWLRSNVDARIEAAFTNADCPESTKRTYPADFYSGPLWDTHIHIPTIFDGPIVEKLTTDNRPVLGNNVTMNSIACTFKKEETEKVFGFFSVYSPLISATSEVAKRTIEHYPETFVPFIMPPDRDDMASGSPTVDAKTLKKMLNTTPGVFKGYGEIGLYAREDGAPELPPDDPKMLAIYDVLMKNGISLVYLHLGIGHGDNLERAAKLYPDIRFIFHGDQLVVYEENGHQNLDIIDKILENHSNIYYGIDELYGDDFLLRPEVNKETFFAHFKNYEPLLEEDIATWSNFITEHATQVLWGTDRGWSSAWSLDQETGSLLTDYTRAFIGRLPKEVQENYAYKNAQRLLE